MQYTQSSEGRTEQHDLMVQNALKQRVREADLRANDRKRYHQHKGFPQTSWNREIREIVSICGDARKQEYAYASIWSSLNPHLPSIAIVSAP
jgi:hypothetical protein